MAETPRSSQPTSGISLRMPQAVRRRCRIAAGLDDMLVRDWVVEVLDRAARERMAAASVEMIEEVIAAKPIGPANERVSKGGRIEEKGSTDGEAETVPGR